MQLGSGSKPRKSVRRQLGLAVAALLGTQVASAEDTQIDSGVLLYSESGGRVSAVEGVVLLSRKFSNDQNMQARFVYDALTGASPNGAIASSQIQTFTRPSGAGNYQVQPGETPLDDTFRDTRFAGSLTYDRPWFSDSKIAMGLQGSGEHDYVSVGGNLGVSRDLNKKNSTISLGLSAARDEISPEGGVPIPFAETVEMGQDQPRDGSSDTKWVVDAVLGMTQVIDRTSLARINYSLTSSSGYHTDPYKIMSVVAPNTGDPLRYLYENRPDSRQKHSLFSQYRKRVKKTTLDVSYRFLWDTWGVTSHTGELRYRIPVSSNYDVEPHIRYYHQSSADFHRLFLVDGEALPVEMSADPRLGNMDAWTVGGKVGGFSIRGNEIAVTLEYYHQFLSSDDEAAAFGNLRTLDLAEDMNAFMLRISHGWPD